MLIGKFEHNIDAKGRVFIPARFRDDLGLHFIVTRGLDGCLYACSMEEWKAVEIKIRALPMSRSRDLQRFFFAYATDVEIDKQGRVLLTADLREYAGLSRDVVITGASNHAEIWDKERWQSVCGGITADKVAQAMDELGF